MLMLKSVRVLLILIGVVLAVSLFIPFIEQPVTTGATLATPPNRDSSEEVKPTPGPGDSGEDNGKDAPSAAIYGQIIDLSTGQPGQNLEIDINGSIIRTDDQGRYSLTGLRAGTYNITLILPGQATAAQSSTTIQLAENETVTVDLNYYGQAPPSPTPADTPEPELELEPTPTAAPVETDTVDEKDSTREAATAAFSPPTPLTDGKTAVWINPRHINNEKGVTGHITIDVANVSDLGAFQARLNFDPKIIEIEDVTLADFLESTGRQTNPLVIETDNTAGQVSFVAYTSGATAGPNGGGTLAVVNFISKQAGVSDLTLENVVLVARLGKPIDAGVGHGRISVTVCFGDLNGDKLIDITDVQAVAGRVGQAVGDPNYVLEYDLNNDKVIDEADVEMIVDRLYETCP